ncbi:NDR1/HIN1-like protein 13 [Pistacia vera]|uniref:NDR1/HIN1-like protein 13 n=1 Tax=Pistacia vera TaxID=55513 RepID=UPI00126351CD|nr:NDR1/HIN1-like protein 13 [Pistacia vera]
MRHHPETNPYFYSQQHSQLPAPTPTPQHESPQHQEPHPQAEPSGMTPPQSQDQIHPTTPWIWPPTQRPTIPPPKAEPLGQWGALVPQGTDGSAPKTQSTHSQAQELAPHSPPRHTGSQATQPPKHQRHRRQQSPQEQQAHQRSYFGLAPRRTKLHTWFLAGFCAIFWLVIILGGLIVLIVYLVFRPHSPSFEVSSVTLNAAYLDVDVLLNADLTVLAKFINPNRKVRVDFSYVVLDLYYGNTLIASQYIEPFRAERRQIRLANVHMVASQVQLTSDETERLKREIERNKIEFQVKGVFRARSNLGSFLRYSYRLYGHCAIEVTDPPGGVLRAVKCKTKR